MATPISTDPALIPGPRLVDGALMQRLINTVNASVNQLSSTNANQFVHGSSATGLTAVGTTRATGLALTAQVNNVTTAAASTGVVLPSISAVGVGTEITVFNNGANAIQVYTNNASTVDGVAGDTGVPLTNTKRCKYVAISATAWLSYQLGVVSA